ncbi:HesB/IscA family protein [Heliophilum fasciatum]|uniref:Fe-S cluster assembly iron-binding protein IscA n=1 Tax=Heliophilum fasciatum TaxID=35700 RepID=A0A4R2RGD4_9FIRM|nr:hypothetical protein [Heliophilum fasciatum]MCW2278966.1 Fe-S cluster assembly iron-binding protein IscA [Heliophilum fasciatum]TCP61784.1 Fe-S cluster assembly iron-binding protein IscA [Heliophilum fasciatum]
MFAVTEKAREALVKLLAATEERYVRILSTGRRPEAIYDLTLEKEPRKGDIAFESSGINFVADDLTKDLVDGLLIDFEDDGLESGIVVRDIPAMLASGGCGCGD